MKSMVLTVMVYIVGTVEAEKAANLLLEKPIAKYEDLIYQSMKSIVSLDELVTTLSVQVARLTTSLSELKADVKRIGDKNVELSTALTKLTKRVTFEGAEITKAIVKVNKRITDESAVAASATKSTQSDLERTKTGISAMQSSLTKDVEKVKTDIAVTMTGFGATKTEIGKLKNSNVEIGRKVDKVNSQVAIVSVEQTKLKNSILGISQKVEKVKTQVAVVSVEQTGRGNGNCVKVCAGTTGRGKSGWRNYSSNGVYMDVNIGRCGYVSTPTITTTIEGTSSHWVTTGTSSIYQATNTKFRIYLSKSNLRVGHAVGWKWNVEWIAVGHTC